MALDIRNTGRDNSIRRYKVYGGVHKMFAAHNSFTWAENNHACQSHELFDLYKEDFIL
jgi:hypothetical protein